MSDEGRQDEWHRLLGDCTEALGTREFFKPLLELIETQLNAVQCMVFSYGGDNVTCLLSINFRTRARGKNLARAYLDQGHRFDPLVATLHELATKTVGERVTRLGEVIDKMPSSYLETFYRKPGLSDKIAVLLVDMHGQLIVNFYYDDPVTGIDDGKRQLTDSYFLLTARLVRAHFAYDTDAASTGPLSILSDRERQVCEGVLAGLKSEMIAADIGISTNSVITYRKRSYRKLGINSRADLFAVCRKH